MNAPCQILPFPAAASAGLLSKVALLHLDGRPFASTAFLPGAGPGAAWNWIVETVAHEQSCAEDVVHCDEGDGYDIITVSGEPVYLVDVLRPPALRI